MKTELLIENLVDGLKPVRSRSVAGDAWVLVLVVAIELGVYWLLGVGREDLREATASMPSFLWKLCSLAVLSALSVAVALRSLDPTHSAQRGLGIIAAFVALILFAGWLVDADTVSGGQSLWTRLNPIDGIQCVISIILLSIPPVMALAFLMRRAAPTDLRGSALSIGIAGGAIGAFLFVFACPHSDPLYVMIWFVLACTVVASTGRLALPAINRW